MYRLDVCLHNAKTDKIDTHAAWSNLVDCMYEREDLTMQEADELIRLELLKFNCVDIQDMPYLEFDTKEHAMQFVLTWS